MLILTSHITPRLQYIVNFFSQQLSEVPWKLTTDVPTFIHAKEEKINYTQQLIEGVFQIQPHTILFQSSIEEISINVSEKNNFKVFFQNHSSLGFDLFAASFYLLSRYEEYLPHDTDIHGRYQHEESLAYKNNFLQTPLINIWIKHFTHELKLFYPDIQIKKNKFTFLPSYDIDMAWSYKHKGFWRNAGNILKDALQLKFEEIKKRILVLSNHSADPFYNFNWLNQLHEKYNIKPYYFFLVAERTTEFDKNISPHIAAMKRLIADHTLRYPIGLHPSYRSNEDVDFLKNEKQILENITGTTVVSSRQHFLKMKMPDTYRKLIQSGILFDFTMGYAGYNGFRASVATPFIWFDLLANETTNLTIFPFCYMEGTSIFYLHETPQQALAEMINLYKAVKEVNGFFCMIWHNMTLIPNTEWEKIYHDFMMRVASESL